MNRKAGFFLVIILITLFSSCKRETQSGWNTDVLIPIANTNLSLSDLVKDSSLITNPDNSLTVAYQSSLYSLNLANIIINLPDTSFSETFKLDSLSLGNQTIIYDLTLGQLALSMAQSSNLQDQIIGAGIIESNGSSAVVPAFSGFSSNIYQFHIDVFQQATMEEGNVTIAINNYLPVPLDSIVMEVRNTNSNTLILRDTILYIAAYDSFFSPKMSIAGKTLENNLNVKLVNLSTPGSNMKPVEIDTSNYVKLYVSLSDLHPSDAIAIFPTQTVLNQTEQITQKIRDRKLTYVQARQGQVVVDITSSVQQPLQLTYILDGAFDNKGRPFQTVSHVPGATTGHNSEIQETFDISGYSINLTGVNGTNFNTYTQTILAQSDSTGQLAHITLADSLHLSYRIQNVAPSYIKGYLGRDTISAIGSSAFSFLNMFKSGTLNLNSVTMNLNVQNGLGVGGVVRLDTLTASSPINSPVSLRGSIIGQALPVNSASDFPLRPGLNTYVLDSANAPNLPNLLSILPNQLQYNVQVQTNINGNNGLYRDFAYLESGLNVNLDAEIPLSLIASHLVLLDTLPFNLSTTNTNVNGITDGIINLIAENKFPIQPVLTMVVYDSTWHPVDTLLMNATISPGILDANCMVDAPKQTVIQLYVNQARLTNIKRGRNAIITADFSTASNNATCNGQHLKIYSNYNLGITFTAKFNYQANAKF